MTSFRRFLMHKLFNFYALNGVFLFDEQTGYSTWNECCQLTRRYKGGRANAFSVN